MSSQVRVQYCKTSIIYLYNVVLDNNSYSFLEWVIPYFISVEAYLLFIELHFVKESE